MKISSSLLSMALVALDNVSRSCARLSHFSPEETQLQSLPGLCVDTEGWTDKYGNTCLWYHEFRGTKEDGFPFLRCNLVPADFNVAENCCICREDYRQSLDVEALLLTQDNFFKDKNFHIQAFRSKKYLGPVGGFFSKEYGMNEFPGDAFNIRFRIWQENPGDEKTESTSGYTLDGPWNTNLFVAQCPEGSVPPESCDPAINYEYFAINPFQDGLETYEQINAAFGHFEFEPIAGTKGFVAIRNKGFDRLMQFQTQDSTAAYYLSHEEGRSRLVLRNDIDKWHPDAAFQLIENKSC